MTPHVVLIEDHRLLRDSMRRYLDRVAGVRVVGIASNAEEAWQYLDLWNPDIVVMNIHVPRAVDGLALVRRIVATYPDITVLVQSTSRDHYADALAAGAHAVLSKNAPDLFTNLVSAVRSVVVARQGPPVDGPAPYAPLARYHGSSEATRRERRSTATEPRPLSNFATSGGIRRWMMDSSAL